MRMRRNVRKWSDDLLPFPPLADTAQRGSCASHMLIDRPAQPRPPSLSLILLPCV